MSRALLLGWVLAGVGCNQVYGLSSTNVIDAFEVPADAPWMCPAGGAAPRFASAANQFSTQNCTSYSVSPDLSVATASCIDGAIWEGPIDQPLTAATLTPATDDRLVTPRLSPEGAELFVLRCAMGTSTCGLARFTRAGAALGSWTYQGDLPMPVDDFTSFSSPSRGPDRRLLVTDAARSIHEYRENSTTWTEVAGVYDPAALGLAEIAGYPRLSSDGLRMTLLGSFTAGAFQWLYAVRPTRADRFTQVVVLPDFAFDVSEVLVTDDCGHGYYSGGTGIGLFFKQQ